MKCLHGLGLGATSKQAEPITRDEEALLWSCGQFGTHSSKALLNTVQLQSYIAMMNTVKLHSYDEHRNLKCAQYQKKVDVQGRVYLEYNILTLVARQIGVVSST